MKGLLLLLFFLLCIATLISMPFLIFLFSRLDYRISRQMQIDLKRDFEATLEKFQIESYEVIVEGTSRGNSTNAFTVYRILFDNKGQYYLYQYVSWSPGVLKPLSRERALLAAGTAGGFKV